MSEESGSTSDEGVIVQDEVDESSKSIYAGQESGSTEFVEESDDDSVKVAPEPVSYLPSWVLKMREKIATSRTAHADAEQRITQLHANVDSLSAKLLVMRPAVLHSNKNDKNVMSEKEAKKAHKNYLHTMPGDVLTLILEYLQIKQILRLDLLSRSFRAMLSASNYWSEAFPLYCPHLQHIVATSTSSTCTAQLKDCLVQYTKDIHVCMEFIQTTKDQRSVPKHRSVQPHRHTRQERQVSHPLPLFGQAANEGTSWGQRANALRSTDRIMSHAETLSSDFRSVAHKALHTMLILTSDCNDAVIYQLANEGAITILTALLMNEEGAIQNDACAIIANLLCWEARKRLLFRKDRTKRIKNAHALTPSARTLCTLVALFGPSASEIDLIYPLRDQVLVCGGMKMLTSLLTSPSASINLASSTNNAYSGNSGNKPTFSNGSSNSSGAGNVRNYSTTTGSVKMSTASSIQGICNKQASRALLALVYPEMPVSYNENINVAQHYLLSGKNIASAEKAHTTTSKPSSIVQDNVATGDRPIDTLSLLGSLDATNNTVGSKSPHKVLLAPLIHTIDNNTTSAATATTTTVDTSIEPTSLPSMTDTTPVQLRAPMISPLFLTDTAARPWLFSYFYKSGAVKDQFTTYLRFVPLYTTVSASTVGSAGKNTTTSKDDSYPGTSCNNDATSKLAGAEVFGRGIDNIGAFTLTGKAQAEISGWTWHIDKSYVPVTFDSSSVYIATVGVLNTVSNDNNTVSGVENSALNWVQGVDREVMNRRDSSSNGINNNNSSSNRATVHVRHVAYWSSGVQNTTTIYTTAQKDYHGNGSYTDPNTGNDATMNATIASTPVVAGELNYIDEEPTGIWGLGLWGVWETSSGTSPHFELQKGGVFRAAPIIL